MVGRNRGVVANPGCCRLMSQSRFTTSARKINPPKWNFEAEKRGGWPTHSVQRSCRRTWKSSFVQTWSSWRLCAWNVHRNHLYLFSIVKSRRWKVNHIDVVGAFLYALHFEVAEINPSDYESHSKNSVSHKSFCIIDYLGLWSRSRFVNRR